MYTFSSFRVVVCSPSPVVYLPHSFDPSVTHLDKLCYPVHIPGLIVSVVVFAIHLILRRRTRTEAQKPLFKSQEQEFYSSIIVVFVGWMIGPAALSGV